MYWIGATVGLMAASNSPAFTSGGLAIFGVQGCAQADPAAHSISSDRQAAFMETRTIR